MDAGALGLAGGRDVAASVPIKGNVGFLQVRDEAGNPIPGYTFDDAYEEIGDDLEMIARWKSAGPDVRSLEGKTVQLAISGFNCDLYSICFVPWSPDPELPDISK